jgi:hypothetical protein
LTPLLLLLPYALGAEEVPENDDRNASSSLEAVLSHVDRFEEYWSHRMRIFSSNVDRNILTLFTDEPGYTVTDDSFFLTRWFNDYFVDDTSFDPTNKSYIRLLGSYGIGSRSDNVSFADIRAKVMLPRSKHRLQLFIGEETKSGDELSTISAVEEHSGIGLRYLRDFFSETLRVSTSVGFSSIDNPYVRLRIGSPLVGGQWLLQPMQTLRYSNKDEFQEWTSLLISYNLINHGAFQWLLQRSTHSGVSGMEYLTEVSYQEINRHRIGIKPYMALFGRTSEVEAYDNGVRADDGVYEYVVGVLWKRPVLRDYIFYELHPGVSFHEQFDYKADYRLQLTLELFIGE